METGFETITLKVQDYISPECTCKIEDIVNAIPHVVESSFDPVNNLLSAKVHRGMTSARDIIKELKECKIRCEQRIPAHERAHLEQKAASPEKKKEMLSGHEMAGMKHEAARMKKPMEHATTQ